VCFGDSGLNTVKGKAHCCIIAQQMSAYNILQYGQSQFKRRQEIGHNGSDGLEVYHPALLTICTLDYSNQCSEVFAVTIVNRLRRA